MYSPYPKFLSRLLFFYMISLLALFANFYVNKYRSGGSGGRPKRKGA
jgi:elongation of very long chain fatty acids protein 4